MKPDTSTRKSFALDYYSQGYNCAQSVLLAYKDLFEIPEKDLLQISCGFGGGMGKLQKTCGAVSGANMVIGLLYGQYKPEDYEAKNTTYHLVREFDAAFKKIHQTTQCKELLGCNMLSDKGRKYYSEHNLSQKICTQCILNSVEILDSLLQSN